MEAGREGRDMLSGDFPYNRIVNTKVFVNQNVTHTYDVAPGDKGKIFTDCIIEFRRSITN